MQVTPVSETDRAALHAMLDAVAPIAGNLWGRWQDEREYEDINDYGKVFAGKLPEGFSLTRMTKRPFGFHFSIASGASFHFTVTGRSVGYKQIR